MIEAEAKVDVSGDGVKPPEVKTAAGTDGAGGHVCPMTGKACEREGCLHEERIGRAGCHLWVEECRAKGAQERKARGEP